MAWGCGTSRCLWRFQPWGGANSSSAPPAPSPTQKVSQAAWGYGGLGGYQAGGPRGAPNPWKIRCARATEDPQAPYLEHLARPGAEGLLLRAQLIALAQGQHPLAPQLLQPRVHGPREGTEVGVRPGPQSEHCEPAGRGG